MKQRLLRIGFALALAAPLVWVLFRSVGGTLAVWIWYVVWNLHLLLRSLPQAAYWSLLVVAAAVIAAASLAGNRTSRRAKATESSAPQGPIRQLARSIERAEQGYYFKWTLARQVAGLLMEAVDAGNPDEPGSRRKLWMERDDPVPTEIQSYVEAALWGGFWQPGKPSRWRRLFRPSDQTALPLELDLETVVRFLEETLEVASER